MSKMVLNVEDKPRPSQLISSVIQQLLANIAATITVPLVIGLGDHISSAILGCGIGTLVYLLITKRKSPVILSSNFAFIGALVLAYTDCGFLGIVLGGFLAGLMYIIFSLLVRFVGTGWIKKVFPPVIIGPVVALIGLSLAGTAVSDLLKVDGYHYIDSIGNTVYPYNLVGLLCGLITFFVIVICAVQKRNRAISMVPFLFGVSAGYLIALIFTIIGNATNNTYLQIIDFSPIVDNFKQISFQSFVSLPKLSLVEGITEITNHSVKLTPMGVLEIALSFIPISLVGFTEHIADHKNLGNIIERDLINDEPGLHKTLLGDGLGSIAGTWFGICPNTTYGEAVSCIAITKNASTMTILVTALSCIGLSFLTPLIMAFRTIPSCVIGGMCLALFGYIAVSGIKMIKLVDFDDDKNVFTLSIILVAGIGALSLRIPYQLGILDGTDFYGVVKWIEITSIAFALLLGISTYAIGSALQKMNDKHKEVHVGDEDEDKHP